MTGSLRALGGAADRGRRGPTVARRPGRRFTPSVPAQCVARLDSARPGSVQTNDSDRYHQPGHRPGPMERCTVRIQTLESMLDYSASYPVERSGPTAIQMYKGCKFFVSENINPSMPGPVQHDAIILVLSSSGRDAPSVLLAPAMLQRCAACAVFRHGATELIYREMRHQCDTPLRAARKAARRKKGVVQVGAMLAPFDVVLRLAPLMQWLGPRPWAPRSAVRRRGGL